MPSRDPEPGPSGSEKDAEVTRHRNGLTPALDGIFDDLSEAIATARQRPVTAVAEEHANADAESGGRKPDPLAALAPAYGRQSAREARLRNIFSAAAALLAGSAIIILWVGCQRALDGSVVNVDAVKVYAFPAGVALIAGGLAWWQAERHRRCSREDLRMHNLLQALGPYVDGMESSVATVVKTLLAPRMFPRSLDDKNPYEDVLWPSAEEVSRLGSPKPGPSSGAGDP